MQRRLGLRLADFLLHRTEPHRLVDAPGRDANLSTDEAQLTRGKIVFAERWGQITLRSADPQVAPVTRNQL